VHIARRVCGDCPETEDPAPRAPYLLDVISPRVALAISSSLSVVVLVLGSYPTGQNKAREDTSLCNFSFVRPGALSADPYTLEQVQRCIDRRRTERWGPWNAWPSWIPERSNDD